MQSAITSQSDTIFSRVKRWMYRDNRPNWLARVANRMWATVAATGITGSRVITLEVVGRKSGRIISFPLVTAVVAGERYLVSMLGDNTQWVQNVRAADGHALLRSGSREEVQLVEIPVDQRAPILKAYIQRADGARPHIPIHKDAPLAEFEQIAAAFPVLHVTTRNPLPKSTPTLKSPLAFFGFTFAFSVPFWLLGALSGKQLLPGLPLSALALICPLLAALLIVYRQTQTSGMTALLKRSFDYQRIRNKLWVLHTFLLMPGVMLLEFGVLRWMGTAVPVPRFSLVAALVLFLVTFVAGIGEELGWTGYAIDPLQERFGALPAAILLGLIWAVWHFIPLLQADRSLTWIAWWTLTTVAQRVIMVWLYNQSGRSVFLTVVYHAMINVTWQLFPVNGSFYDPRITGLIVTGIALSVSVVGMGHQPSQTT
ncbi:MAG: nitroreductase/quinone reductase family protein [Caldilineaceae bacterium]